MRVAVLGQGSIGRRHSTILRQLGHTVAAFDPAASADAHNGDGMEWCSDETAALTHADAAVVATPSSLHAEHVGRALDLGLPVLVEKPVAVEAAAARALESRVTAEGARLAVGMNLRFHPGVTTVRRLILEGAIGRPLRAAVWFGSWLPGWRPGVDYRGVYSAQAALGGGVILDAIHELDYVTWILGPVARVGASLRHVSSLDLDVEDVAHLQLEHVSGTMTSVTLDYLDHAYHRGCRIVAEEGTLEWSWEDGRVVHHRSGGGTSEHLTPSDVGPTYIAQMERFIELARGTAPPAAGIAEARHVMDVVEAARRSSWGQVVVPVARAEHERPGDARVELRPLTLDDVGEHYVAWLNDPEVNRYLESRFAEQSLDTVRAWVAEHLARDDTLLLAIVETATGRHVGNVKVGPLNPHHATADLGLIIGEPDCRGKGYGSEAIAAAAKVAFERLGARKLTASAYSGNIPSRRAFERAGWTFEGVRQAQFEADGEAHDSLMFGCLNPYS